MKIPFSKYQGTGNDFVMIDSTKNPDLQLIKKDIAFLCHRRFGVGADGVIQLFSSEKSDFKMVYYNSDGSQSFCGNGARCATLFAHKIGLIKQEAYFEAFDGKHYSSLQNDLISVKMADVKKSEIEQENGIYIINTGSPHYIAFTTQIAKEDIVAFGHSIRYSPRFQKDGINVNLAEIETENQLKMLTYERGVENETYSCGTGATAVALAYGHFQKQEEIDVQLNVKGGQLFVKATQTEKEFIDLFLIGPAKEVFKGEIEIEGK